MNQIPLAQSLLSRRTWLQSTAASLAGLASCSAQTPATAQPEVVDVHVHVASSRLSRMEGSDALPEPYSWVEQPGGLERLGRHISDEFRSAGVTHALCMPSSEISDTDPLGIAPTLKHAQHVTGVKLHPIGIAHPERFDLDHLKRVEGVLEQGQVKALKAYLGYLHYEPYSVGYRPYFRLAAKYRVPIIFHTGDTNSRVAKVKYAHPLPLEEIAVDFPHTQFVLAHFGNPWTLDAAQVVYKNPNVWVDLSAFLIGDAAAFAKMQATGVIERTVRRVQEAIEFAEADDRFMFGSDWPLSPIGVYRDFVTQLFPAEQRSAVLAGNAKRLFGLEK